MSRSYKKNPYVKDGSRKWTKYAKRQSNKKIRKCKDIPNYSKFKQIYDTWNIHDYSVRKSKQEAIEEWKQTDCMYDTIDEVVNWWRKFYFRK